MSKRRDGHSELHWDKNTGSFKTIDPHPEQGWTAPKRIGTGTEDLSRVHADLVQALEALILTASLLQQNSESCAVQHHGANLARDGLPGWLRDTERTIEEAMGALSKAKALEQPVGAGE